MNQSLNFEQFLAQLEEIRSESPQQIHALSLNPTFFLDKARQLYDLAVSRGISVGTLIELLRKGPELADLMTQIGSLLGFPKSNGTVTY